MTGLMSERSVAIQRARLIPAVVVCCAMAGAAHAGAPTYSVTYLGPATRTAAINSAGDSVGRTTTTGIRGWVSVGGAPLEILPLPAGYSSSEAHDINDAGVIVGSVATGSFPEFGEAVAWLPDGSGGYTTQLFGNIPGASMSIARRVNNVGDIVGNAITGSILLGSPAVWFNAPGGVMNLNALGLNGNVGGLNDNRVVMTHELLLDLDDNSLTTIPIPSTLAGQSLLDVVFTNNINNSGQVAGHVVVATAQPADQIPARYTPGTGWEALFPFPVNFGSAYGINSTGDTTLDSAGDNYVHTASGGPFNLELLLDAPSTGWLFSTNFGSDINDAGQIVTTGTNPGTGQSGAVLLTPVNCDADVDASGAVDINDISFVIFRLGSAGPQGDADGNGIVDSNDIAFVIFRLGPCP